MGLLTFLDLWLKIQDWREEPNGGFDRWTKNKEPVKAACGSDRVGLERWIGPAVGRLMVSDVFVIVNKYLMQHQNFSYFSTCRQQQKLLLRYIHVYGISVIRKQNCRSREKPIGNFGYMEFRVYGRKKSSDMSKLPASLSQINTNCYYSV